MLNTVLLVNKVNFYIDNVSLFEGGGFVIISISGPTKSGKSTIINLLKDTLPKSTVYVEDFYYTVWQDMIEQGDFTEFTEVTKDRGFMFMYVSKLCTKYLDMINKYENYDGLVVVECCYLDYLIYSQLNTWYHYPISGYLEDVINKYLSTVNSIHRIYMTTANDPGYPLSNSTFEYKTSKAVFNRNRSLELRFYEIYRDNKKVLSLPSDTLSCDKIVLDDLVNLGIIGSSNYVN